MASAAVLELVPIEAYDTLNAHFTNEVDFSSVVPPAVSPTMSGGGAAAKKKTRQTRSAAAKTTKTTKTAKTAKTDAKKSPKKSSPPKKASKKTGKKTSKKQKGGFAVCATENVTLDVGNEVDTSMINKAPIDTSIRGMYPSVLSKDPSVFTARNDATWDFQNYSMNAPGTFKVENPSAFAQWM